MVKKTKAKAKGKRYTLSEIRSKNKAGGHFFFSKDTMRYHRKLGTTNKTRYNRKTGTNYVVVQYPLLSIHAGREVWYRFVPKTGDLAYIGDAPQSMR